MEVLSAIYLFVYVKVSSKFKTCNLWGKYCYFEFWGVCGFGAFLLMQLGFVQHFLSPRIEETKLTTFLTFSPPFFFITRFGQSICSGFC